MVAIFKEFVEEDFEEVDDYTNEQIEEFFTVIFSQPVSLALKFLRGSSGLDISVLEPLRDPHIYKLVNDGLNWINDNCENIIINFINLDADSDDDSDYIPSDSEDSDDEIIVENDIYLVNDDY